MPLSPRLRRNYPIAVPRAVFALAALGGGWLFVLGGVEACAVIEPAPAPAAAFERDPKPCCRAGDAIEPLNAARPNVSFLLSDGLDRESARALLAEVGVHLHVLGGSRPDVERLRQQLVELGDALVAGVSTSEAVAGFEAVSASIARALREDDYERWLRWLDRRIAERMHVTERMHMTERMRRTERMHRAPASATPITSAQ